MKTERLDALKILISLIKDKKSLALLNTNAKLSPFTKELCYGVCRHYYRLSAIADLFVKKRPKEIELWLLLLLGLYQLHFLKKPPFAAVKETVELLTPLKKVWAKGLINAVLRNYCREEATIETKLVANKSYLFNHPEWFIKAVQKDWPNDWQAILAANDSHPPMSLRVNVSKTSRQNYLNLLQEKAISAFPHAFSETGIRLEKPVDVQSLPEFNEGLVSVQDEAAQFAAEILDLKEGQKVLDACAAPGGKTCHILETEPNLKECIAIDIDEKRLERVKQNLERLKLKATLILADALEPNRFWNGELYDRILLDAPCSATGVIRRHPDIKLLRTVEEVEAISQLQKAILQSLWPLLKEGGLFLYATCSILKTENEHQIKAFLDTHRDCELMEIQAAWGLNTGYGRQIFPQSNEADGFFYSLLKKVKV
ncbi:MAG: 16S rRNA (cytosine(967)-C(5))-methyltransferase RsmB [Proteobacteria bacterium]|nr:16S rRNA (cytosine(967)-C(5))-methyltransferase RsmB [Pseudomonadota bacterium]